MFGFGSNKNKSTQVEQVVDTLNVTLEQQKISESLEENFKTIKELFENDSTMTAKYVKNIHDESMLYCIAFCDGVSSAALINEHIIEPLMTIKVQKPDKDIFDTLMMQVLHVNEIKTADNYKDVVEAITYGDTILFAQGQEKALILNSKGFTTRGISEPDSEKVLSGPKEGFTESMMVNISLLHRKLRTNELKLKFKKIGKRASTNVCVCYLEGIVNKNVLKELERRLERINIDAILDSEYVTELIKDAPFSLFQTVGTTERPDVLAAKILEGRVGLLVDGSPVALTVPYLFVENFQSSEDYYVSFLYATIGRLYRIIGFLLTITVPAFYIAVAAYNHELLPTPLLLNIAMERTSVPFPAALEAFLMLAIFDLLKETGARMPSTIGSSLSIVGALVIGQAAVEAKFVAAPMVIIIGLTGITGLLVPRMNAPNIYIRVFLLLSSTVFGLYGITLGLAVLYINILNLNSFGIKEVITVGKFRLQDTKDIFVRAPWWSMITRGKDIAEDPVRLKPKGGK